MREERWELTRCLTERNKRDADRITSVTATAKESERRIGATCLRGFIGKEGSRQRGFEAGTPEPPDFSQFAQNPR